MEKLWSSYGISREKGGVRQSLMKTLLLLGYIYYLCIA